MRVICLLNYYGPDLSRIVGPTMFHAGRLAHRALGANAALEGFGIRSEGNHDALHGYEAMSPKVFLRISENQGSSELTKRFTTGFGPNSHIYSCKSFELFLEI